MRRKPLSKFNYSPMGEGVGHGTIFQESRRQIIRELYAEGLMGRTEIAKAFGLTFNSVAQLCRGIPIPRKWLRPTRERVQFPTPEVTPGCGYSVIVERAHATLKEYQLISDAYAQAEASRNATEEPPKAMAAKK